MSKLKSSIKYLIKTTLGRGEASASVKSYALNSGERQVASHLEGIRQDHRLRYELAVRLLRENGVSKNVILDCFCGNGYGSRILSEVSQDCMIIGIDASAEAITQAREHYQSAQTWFMQDIFPFSLPHCKFEAVVSLESLEHIKDYNLFFSTLCDAVRPSGCIVLSTPNQRIMPLERNHFKFHQKHFLPEEIDAMLAKQGITLKAIWGQNCYVLESGSIASILPADYMGLEPDDRDAQFQIYFGVKN